MILVTGSLLARPETLDELLELSLEHVERSRTEPGCWMHGVHRDVEQPNRLVFFEKWADRAALQAHFLEPASLDFVRRALELVAEAPKIEVFEATPVDSVRGGGAGG